jgi:cell division protein FtsZ
MHENRIAELTQRLRADSQRLAERLERNEVARAAAPAASATPAAPVSQAVIDSAGTAAVAAALEDVTIRPIPPKPSLFEPVASQPTPPEADTPKVFIPPQPERPVNRAPRMPRIDELPVPAQNEIRARRGEPEAEHPEKRRMSLLQRLAAVGLGRREEPEEAAEDNRPPARQMPPLPERLPQRPIPRDLGPRPDPVSEYAKRSPQGLDQHGRQSPVNNPADDDQLDIPAFLRRQAN